MIPQYNNYISMFEKLYNIKSRDKMKPHVETWIWQGSIILINHLSISIILTNAPIRHHKIKADGFSFFVFLVHN